MRPIPTISRRARPALRIGALALASILSLPANAQESSLATVGDSATAWQWIQQMEDQARENPAEAARLAQRLLDGYERKLVPAGGDAELDRDLFMSVRERVQRFLLPRPPVLERYRAFESAEAERTLAAGDLAGTAATRALTLAGLKANLILAEREVRGGRFALAERRLAGIEGHPDLRGEESATYWFLRSVAARLLGRDAAAKDAANRLANLDAPTWVEGLALAERLVPRSETPAVDPGTFADWQPVWRDDLADSPFERSSRQAPVGSRRPDSFLPDAVTLSPAGQAERSAWMVLWPVFHRESILVNDGLQLRAIDRLSRRERWTRTLVDRRTIDNDGRPPGDLLGIAVGEGTAVAYSMPGQSMDRNLAGTIAAFDAESGSERWKVSLSALGGEEFGGLVPMGLPLVGDGQVVVLARRVTPRLETVEYLLGLDLSDGSLRWSTFLCSSGGIRLLSNRPCSTPVATDGSILVATVGGGVGRIDPADGRVEWFRRFLVPIRDLRLPAEPWELGGPAVSGNSVFALAPDQSEIVQLDLRTGRTLASFPLGIGSTWGSPRYLLPDGDRILSIGADVRALDAAEPDRLLWSFAEQNAELVRSLPGSASRSGIRGRVIAAGEHVLVPTLDRLLFLSRETGRVERSIPLDFPGNPVFSSQSDVPQLLVAGISEIACLMPGDAAERSMRARLVARPDDPQSALALLDLAVRGNRVELAIESGRLAGAAIDRVEDATAALADRDELLRQLLRAAAGCGPGAAEAEPIHQLAREVSRSARQKATQRLAEADWLLARSRRADAVAALRPLIDDPILAKVILEADSGRALPASTVAIEQLQSLPPEFLAELDRAGGPPLPGTPRDLDRRLAAAASAASPGEAMRILADAWRCLPAEPRDEASARRVLDAVRNLAVGNGWSGMIGELDRSMPVDEPQTATAGSSPRFPSLAGPFPTVLTVPGRLVAQTPNALSGRPRDGLLVVDERALVLRSGPDLGIRWRRPVDDRNPIVLAWTPDGIVLWEDSSERGERVSLLDREDGKTVASTPAAREILPVASLLDAGMPAGQIMPNEEPYLAAETFPLLAGDRLVVVRRSGDVASFRIPTLERPDWIRSDLLDQVYAAELVDWGLLLAGRARTPDRPQGFPAMVVLDPASGAELSRTELAEDIRWASLSPFGEAVAGTASEVLSINAWSGAPIWSLTGTTGEATIGATRIGPRLLLRDSAEGFSGVNLRDGRNDPMAFRVREIGSVGGEVKAEIPLGDMIALHRTGRIQLFRIDGRPLGEDAIADERDFTHAVPVQGGLVVLNALGARQVPLPDRTGSRTEFVYLLYLLEADKGLRLGAVPVEIRVPGQRIDRILAIDGALAFTNGGETLVVPMPFGGDAGGAGVDPRPDSR